ncbi:nucleotidyltransferase domain-containing protein [Hyalangium gracile]|uniref:nucleotidyltransferase domain-containing protein n=1 Tax=Hyalangium gracile TaxID=394092 RepID=UPI001CCFDAE1|nr:nucleotidyltransferase domain-containing protein [Hyalangium gracile]
MTTLDSRLDPFVQRHPYPLVFMTVSGSHIYGFPSPDSDWDLRGVHVLPAREVVGLDTGPETVEQSTLHEGLEMDLVTHDVSKFFGLLLRRNGYVLEQLFSPLVLRSSPEHQELKALANACITRHHAHHYLGFAETQWRLFEKERPRRVKPLLYVYRVLLTGIHLMRTGRVEPNLVTLNEGYRLPYIHELVQRKLEGSEKGTLKDADFDFHEREFHRLREELEQARDSSQLPNEPSGRAGLHELLVRIRLATAK